MVIEPTIVGATIIVAIIMSALLFMCKIYKISVSLAVFSLLATAGIILPRIGILFNLPSLMRFEGDRFSPDQEVVLWGSLRLSHEDANMWFGNLTLVAAYVVGISVWIIIRFLALPKRSKTSTHFQPLKKKTEVIHASDWLPRVK